tara:strand:- start:41 stop:229 length:189 start_codon:yes stop_codon:yes gene_type:complete
MKKFNIEKEFWETLDKWLSEEVDKELLSQLFLGVGTFLQQELKGKKEGKRFASEYVTLQRVR